jgi:hypothetical protein
MLLHDSFFSRHQMVYESNEQCPLLQNLIYLKFIGCSGTCSDVRSRSRQAKTVWRIIGHLPLDKHSEL